jgi:hypothetical protein
MELGGLLQMSDLDGGVEFYEQLMYPTKALSNRLEGVWWLPAAGTNARLVVTNTTGVSTTAQISFSLNHGAVQTSSVSLGPWQLAVLDLPADAAASGPEGDRFGGVSIEYTGPPGAVIAKGLVLNGRLRYSSMISLTDPSQEVSSGYQGAGVRVGTIGQEQLRPIIIARNVGSVSTQLVGRLTGTSDDGKLKVMTFPGATIPAGGTVKIDASDAWTAAASLRSGSVGVEFEYSTTPGTVIISVSSVSTHSDHVFTVPLTDPPASPSGTGSYFVRLEPTRSSIVFLKNVTDQPQRFTFYVRYDGGVWNAGVQSIDPHQSRTIDIGSLRDQSIHDSKGRVIPAGVTGGQVHWSIGGGRDPKGMIGRMEQVDFAHDVSSTYACPIIEGDYFDSSWSEPDSVYLTVLDGYTYGYITVWEQDKDIYGDSYDPIDIAGSLDWTTGSDPSPIEVGGGYIGAVAQGDDWAYGNGYSVGIESDENPYPVPISAGAFASVSWCQDSGKSSLVQQYHDHSITFYVPGCSDIRDSLTNSYYLITWDGLTNFEKNDAKPLGVINEAMAGGVDSTLLDYDVYGPYGYAGPTSGYRSPNGNATLSGASPTSRHMSGEAVDLGVSGYLDGSHYGTGRSDTTSVAYQTWLSLQGYAATHGGTHIESWETMYDAVGGANGDNHMHAEWRR